MEKRIPIAIVVHLTLVHDHSLRTTELTYTDNISEHGACVISNRPWNVDDAAEVTAMEDELALRGRVIHCQKRSENRYAVGLAFLDQVRWARYRRWSIVQPVKVFVPND